jgi:hypothetical protein
LEIWIDHYKYSEAEFKHHKVEYVSVSCGYCREFKRVQESSGEFKRERELKRVEERVEES